MHFYTASYPPFFFDPTYATRPCLRSSARQRSTVLCEMEVPAVISVERVPGGDGTKAKTASVFSFDTVNVLCLFLPDVETLRATSLQPAPSSSLPVFDLSPYPAGTYLVKINFERGVSVVRKVVKS